MTTPKTQPSEAEMKEAEESGVIARKILLHRCKSMDADEGACWCDTGDCKLDFITEIIAQSRAEARKEGRDQGVRELDREKLADLSHEIWSHWMKYLFSVSRQNSDGSVTIPDEKVSRWTHQSITDYADLTEKEKDSDRDQADKIIQLLSVDDAKKDN